MAWREKKIQTYLHDPHDVVLVSAETTANGPHSRVKVQLLKVEDTPARALVHQNALTGVSQQQECRSSPVPLHPLDLSYSHRTVVVDELRLSIGKLVEPTTVGDETDVRVVLEAQPLPQVLAHLSRGNNGDLQLLGSPAQREQLRDGFTPGVLVDQVQNSVWTQNQHLADFRARVQG